MSRDLLVFSGTAGRSLAQRVCNSLSLFKETGHAIIDRFNDGEIRVQLLENVRHADVFILNPLQSPADNLLEMILLASAARGSSAKRVILVPTYLGYNRQDRKDKPRVPISSQIIARLLSQTRPDNILLLDLHSPTTMGFFDVGIITDHVYASVQIIPYLKSILKNDFVVASPDKGGVPRAEAYAKRLLGIQDYVLFTKSRPEPGEIDKSSIRIIGDVKGKDILFVDDILDTAGTVVHEAEVAKEHGARNIYVCVTHALFSKDAIKRLDNSLIKEVIITDSVYHSPEKLKTKRVEITVISIAPLLAEAIKRIHQDKSLSELFV